MKSKSAKASRVKSNKKAIKPKKAATKAKSYAAKAKPSKVSKVAKAASSKVSKPASKLNSKLIKSAKPAKKTASAKKTSSLSAKKAPSTLKKVQLKVRDIMHKSILLMKPSDNLQNAAKKMHEKDLGCIFVSENDRIAGIITDRDIVARAISHGSKFDSVKLKDIMSSKILYCFEEDSLQKATQNMAKNQVRPLPVLNRQKKLVGLLSLENIAFHSSKNTSGKSWKKIGKKK